MEQVRLFYLESINQTLRAKFIEIAKYDIELRPNADIVTELSYCENTPNYFEPLFITVDDMFMPTRRENYDDYTDFFFQIAKSSDNLMTELENGLRGLYGAEFESSYIEPEQIKLKGRNPFGIKSMSSGHYSFLNVYCHLRFSQFAFQWESVELWSFLNNELCECEKLSESIADKIEKFNNNYAGTQSRVLAAALESERERSQALHIAVGIAKSRFETITGTGTDNNSRSRARDREIALRVSQALQ
ncbi:MAG: hypothetical protein LBJ12_08500 [Oscillospiraceae bacterium]|jgi:hypothetical protein|nr:hypothetical protein [Oscillospiraceae bacterium]